MKLKKIANFSNLHCFIATQDGSKRTSKKDQLKTLQNGAGWPPLLLYVGETRAGVFQNPCKFWFKPFVSLASIGLKMLSSFVTQCLGD